MKKEKSARIVKEYSLVLGWLLLSPMLLIPGYMLAKRIDEKRASVGPIIALAIIFGLLSFLGFAFLVSGFTDPELLFSRFDFILFYLLFFYLVSGNPFVHSIRYLIEERKNPTVPYEPADQRIAKLEQLFNNGYISQEDFEKRKSSILDEI